METATIIKPTELISIELFVDKREVEVKDIAIAVVKIEGYPDGVTFTVKSSRSYEGEFKIIALVRNNGSIFNLEQLREAGIEYNFHDVKEAHKNLYETAERRYLEMQKENRKKTYDSHPIIQLSQIFKTNKDYEVWLPFLCFTSKEDYVEKNVSLYYLYIDRPYDKSHEFKATFEYSRDNIKLSHNFKNITFKSAQSAIKKVNVLWTEFCAKIDSENKEISDKGVKVKELEALIGYPVEEQLITDASRFKRNSYSTYHYWGIVLTDPKSEYSKRKLLFTEYTNREDNVQIFNIRGIDAKFTLENFKKIVDIFIISAKF